MGRDKFIDSLMRFTPKNMSETQMDAIEQFCFGLYDKSDVSALRTQLAKANERIAELERELKESDDDLVVTQKQSSSYENELEEVQAVFVDSDACPLFEPFNPRNLSAWLNKFAMEKKIEAYKLVLNEYGRGMHPDHQNSLRSLIEQIRKEQE